MAFVRALSLLFILSALTVWSHPHEGEHQESGRESVNSPVKLWDSWVIKEPFVPTKRDYALEVGTMWKKENLYWVGFGLGFNLGTCVFSDSQTCQQYLDLTSGGAARDSETHGIWFASLRWQFVNFPDTFSPMARLFLGGDLLNVSGEELTYDHLGGIGVGITQYLNDRADTRLEYRLGYSDEVFSQLTFAVHIKIDTLVSYFGKKLKDIGIDTFEAGSDVIEAGGDVIQDTGDVITQPILGDEKDGDSSSDNAEKGGESKDSESQESSTSAPTQSEKPSKEPDQETEKKENP